MYTLKVEKQLIIEQSIPQQFIFILIQVIIPIMMFTLICTTAVCLYPTTEAYQIF